jgi:hypothetical protein
MKLSQEIYQQIELCLDSKTPLEQYIKADAKIDELIGHHPAKIEKELTADNENDALYLTGLAPLVLNNSYADFFLLLKNISIENEMATIIDIGAGHCRMAVLSKLFFPKLKVISIEPVAQRIPTFPENKDIYPITFSELPDTVIGDYYFLYFPTGPILEEILRKIKSYQHQFSIIAIESHGELINRLKIESAWLEVIEYIKLTYPRHNPICYLFEKISESQITLEELNTKIENFSNALIDNDWIADTKELELHFDKEGIISFEFKFPPRIVEKKLKEIDDIKFCSQEDFDEETKKLLNLRSTNDKITGHFIRKIFPYKRKFELSDSSIKDY